MWDKMETPKILYDLDTSGGLMEVSLSALQLCHKSLPYASYNTGIYGLKESNESKLQN